MSGAHRDRQAVALVRRARRRLLTPLPGAWTNSAAATERAAQGRKIKEDRDVLPGMELMSCPDLAVPRDVMHHVVRVESSYNPYAIGVVGGRLVRQPRNLAEAVSTARMLEQRGYNFSLGLAQVNRYNLAKYGLTSYEHAFQPCANLVTGSRILRECYGRSGNDWGKSFSCYYSGDFKTGFRHGYVQKVFASMRRGGGETAEALSVEPIAVIDRATRRASRTAEVGTSLVQRRAVAVRALVAPIGSQSPMAMAQPQPLPSAPPIAAAPDTDPGKAAARSASVTRPVVATASRTSAPSPAIEMGDGAFVF